MRVEHAVVIAGGGPAGMMLAAELALAGVDVAVVERMKALVHVVSELASLDDARKRLAGLISGLDIHYDLGEGHPLLGRRMPDLDLVTAAGPRRVFELLHDAKPAW
jgi:choline dehydrogenase-like flavoprotein